MALLVIAAVGGPAARAEQARDLASYVDPLIGTAPAPSAHYGAEFDGGDVFPGVAYPSGMLAWSPDTAEHSLPGGYFFPDQTIKGFSLTHFSGRGCTVYQDVPIMPVPGDARLSARSTFSHANEHAEPGYYAVTLDSGVRVELSVTPRTGLATVAFPPGSGTLLIDAGGSVNGAFDSHVDLDAEHQLVSGFVESQVGCGTDHYTLYFAIAFDRSFAAFGTWQEDRLQADTTTARAPHTGAYVSFDTTANAQVRLKPAISYVSVANALDNLQAEDQGWDFAQVRSGARQAWNETLRSIEVSGGSDTNLSVFYTALYHSFLHPNLFSDANGDYIGFDDGVHRVAPGHAHYHNIPGWDEYRSLIQLRSMLAPDQASDIVQSLVDDAAQGGGGMPRWEQANRNSAGMVGDSPAIYVANAYAFGARGFDAAAALEALDRGASTPGTTSGGHAVREWLEPWLALGYIPDQPSISLEYAADDFAIAQLAGALGQWAMRDAYLLRAASWTNTFNPLTGHVEPRDRAGQFAAVDHSQACCGFVEGNAAQYTFMVPFDPAGLVEHLGGPAATVVRLDDFFAELNAGPNQAHAWIGNEPGLHAPWLYDFAGAPQKTQALVRRIQLELFSDTPGGLPGNDDGGTISAWYVLSALGLYPAIPGVGGVALGSPLFADAQVHLANGRVLHIIAPAAADNAPYVHNLTLDSTPYTTPWLDWPRLATGATLHFSLSPEPD